MDYKEKERGSEPRSQIEGAQASLKTIPSKSTG